MRSITLLAALLLAGSALAQTEIRTGLKKSAQPAAKIQDQAPVTTAEAIQVLDKIQGAIAKVNHLKPAPQTKLVSGAKPLSRDAMALEYQRIFDWVKPAFSSRPAKPEHYDPKVLKFGTSQATKAANYLVSWGAMDKTSPMATSASQNLSLVQFGDSVGYFLSRLAELTQIPSTAYSPFVNNGAPGR